MDTRSKTVEITPGNDVVVGSGTRVSKLENGSVTPLGFVVWLPKKPTETAPNVPCDLTTELTPAELKQQEDIYGALLYAGPTVQLTKDQLETLKAAYPSQADEMRGCTRSSQAAPVVEVQSGQPVEKGPHYVFTFEWQSVVDATGHKSSVAAELWISNTPTEQQIALLPADQRSIAEDRLRATEAECRAAALDSRVKRCR